MLFNLLSSFILLLLATSGFTAPTPAIDRHLALDDSPSSQGLSGSSGSPSLLRRSSPSASPSASPLPSLPSSSQDPPASHSASDVPTGFSSPPTASSSPSVPPVTPSITAQSASSSAAPASAPSLSSRSTFAPPSSASPFQSQAAETSQLSSAQTQGSSSQSSSPTASSISSLTSNVSLSVPTSNSASASTSTSVSTAVVTSASGSSSSSAVATFRTISSVSSVSASTRTTSIPHLPVPTTGPAEVQAYLDGHNAIRASAGSPPLTWSEGLASSAASYASQCRFAHSGGSLGPVGENLAAGTGYFPASAAVALFSSDQPDPAHQFTHYTQVVWKSTTQLGCGVAFCSGIFDKPATYHVCLYDPVGNVVGEQQTNL